MKWKLIFYLNLHNLVFNLTKFIVDDVELLFLIELLTKLLIKKIIDFYNMELAKQFLMLLRNLNFHKNNQNLQKK